MCLRFIPNSEVTGELRGAPVIRADARAIKRSRKMREVTAGHRVIMDGTMIAGPIYPCEVWFLLMPGRLQIAELLEEHPMGALIVDYHADVLNLTPRADHSPDSKQAGSTVPDESWEWWQQPEPQEAMSRSLAAADLITTPFPEYIPALKTFGHPVIHLPDTRPKDWVPFRKAWANDVTAAIQEIANGIRDH